MRTSAAQDRQSVARRRVRLRATVRAMATGALASLLVACVFVGEYAPVSESAVLGVPVSYELYTECGLAQSAVDFDASMWTPIGVSAEELSHTPIGLESPRDPGTLTLVEPDRATFRSNTGRVFDFERHAGNLERRDC